jgi:hypothetical protein
MATVGRLMFTTPITLTGGRRDGFDGVFPDLVHEALVGSILIDEGRLVFVDEDEVAYSYRAICPGAFHFILDESHQMDDLLVPEPVGNL